VKADTREIVTNCFGIVVTLGPEGCGAIRSDLHDQVEEEPDSDAYKSAMDAIESMVLAHACAGIDIGSPRYLQGVEEAVLTMAGRV